MAIARIIIIISRDVDKTTHTLFALCSKKIINEKIKKYLEVHRKVILLKILIRIDDLKITSITRNKIQFYFIKMLMHAYHSYI